MQTQKTVYDKLKITPLGGGQEVGKSCLLLQFKERNIILDCGIAVGIKGIGSMPAFDLMPIEPSEIDLVLITHCHLDHSASLPFLTEKLSGFQARIFMTHATKALTSLIINDIIGLRNEDATFDKNELKACLDRVEVIDFHQTKEVKGVKFTAYAAGHVLGAAMFEIDIEGVKILYTGDYSMEENRHLKAAEIPAVQPDVLIIESTMGVQTYESITKREDRFTKAVDTIVSGGGKCLIPVMTAHAQELLLILDEYWQNHPRLHQKVPTFYVSQMGEKALRVYQTFVNVMNSRISALADISNPFQYKHIRNVRHSAAIDESGPCVVFAGPGMLQSGVSRQICERWIDDERNGIVLAEYATQGNLAFELLHEPATITCLDGRELPRKCSIDYVSFAAHVDYTQNVNFMRAVMPSNIVLVHGVEKKMKGLKLQLEKDIKSSSWPGSKKPSVAMPANLTSWTVDVDTSLTADLVGSLADHVISSFDAGGGDELVLSEPVVVATENFNTKVFNLDELASYTPYRRGRVFERIVIPVPSYVSSQLRKEDAEDNKDLSYPVLTIAAFILAEVFDKIYSIDSGSSLLVEDIIYVRALFPSESSTIIAALAVEWEGTPVGDMAADAAVGMLTDAFSAPTLLLSMAADINMGAVGDKRALAQSSEKMNKTEASANDDRIQKMKSCLIDPSKAPEGLNCSYSDCVDSKRSRLDVRDKLEAIRRLLESALTESTDASISVMLNTLGDRLIVRKVGQRMLVPEEAYCMFEFSNDKSFFDNPLHHVVIKSDSTDLKQQVVDALKGLSLDAN